MPIPKPIQEVAALLQRLPGVGEKSALKYALFLASHDKVEALGEALKGLPSAVRPCLTCRALVEAETHCPYCAREGAVLCVVHRFVDLLAVERAAGALGLRYFVLGRLLSPLEGIDAEDLPLVALIGAAAGASEVVLALPASVEGEATALLVTRELQAHRPNVRITQLARGLPHGGDVEYVDVITLRGALDQRAPAATIRTPEGR